MAFDVTCWSGTSNTYSRGIAALARDGAWSVEFGMDEVVTGRAVRGYQLGRELVRGRLHISALQIEIVLDGHAHIGMNAVACKRPDSGLEVVAPAGRAFHPVVAEDRPALADDDPVLPGIDGGRPEIRI